MKNIETKLNKIYEHFTIILISISAIFIMFFYLPLLFDFGMFNSTITHYSKIKNHVPLLIHQYNVDKEKQKVTRVIPNLHTTGVYKYEDCLILDRKNWECRGGGSLGLFGFKNGNFYPQSGIIDISKREWYEISRKGFYGWFKKDN